MLARMRWWTWGAVGALAAVALAQEGATPAAEPLRRPTGTLLLEALPPFADMTLHTPDLPALLRSAEAAGVGTAASWHDAFAAQLRRWGADLGEPDRLLRGGEALFGAADGEALLASMDLPSPVSGGKRERSTLIAFRSSRRADELRAALQDVIEAGLRVRYPAEPRTEDIVSHPVIALAAADAGLWIRVQDGLVAASDHPLALGLLFRGLQRVGESGRTDGGRSMGPQRLEVRYGKPDVRWTGWVWGGRESVSWRAGPGEVSATAPLPVDARPVLAVAVEGVCDLPVFPARVPDWVADVGRKSPTGPRTTIALEEDGSFRLHQVDWAWTSAETKTAAVPTERLVVGAASRLGWLRAIARGAVPSPIPGIDVAALNGPIDASPAAPDARVTIGPLIEWQAPDQPGELRGPLWHGPATFLALRTLHDICTQTAPGASEPPKPPAEPERPPTPLPPPVPPK